MPNAAHHRSLELSQKLYGRLLAAYPRPHRQAYGGAMAQLFRDQCRDAWAEGRTLGLLALWLRTLPDLVKTSFLERLSTLNPGKFMSDKLHALLRPRHSPMFTFFTVFTVAFLLVFLASGVITFLLPESYASTARIKVEPEDNQNGAAAYDPNFSQTAVAVILSQSVLNSVVNTLDLNASWGKKHYGGGTLKSAQTIELLKCRLEISPVRNTSLIAVTAYSDEKHEAAQLANAVAKAYADYRLNSRRAAIDASLNSLQTLFKEQVSQIEQLQTDKEALAQKFDIVENPESFKEKYQAEIIEDQRTLKQMATQHSHLKALDNLREVLPTVTADTALTDLLGKLHVAQQTYVTLTNDYAAADLHVTRILSVMRELNQEIDDRVAGIMIGLETEIAAKQANVEALSAQVTARIQKLKPTPEDQPYWDKKHELEQQLSLHNAIQAKINASQLDRINPPTQVQITDVAEPSDYAAKPDKALNLLVGAIAGLILGGVAGSIAAFIAQRVGRRLPKAAGE